MKEKEICFDHLGLCVVHLGPCFVTQPLHILGEVSVPVEKVYKCAHQAVKNTVKSETIFFLYFLF